MLALHLQGWIQGSSSYANGEVVFPSYEMLSRLKKERGVIIQSNSLCIFPCGLRRAKFPVITREAPVLKHVI